MQVRNALRAAGSTHPGLLRTTNEDRFHYDPARGIFIVIDGVGGQAAGDTAAETALRTIREGLEEGTGPVDARIRDVITRANNEIYRLASLRPEWKGMACVLTVAVLDGTDVVVGHVGDTRLYKVRGGRIEKLTKDHSPVGEREDAGELSETEAMRHPRRNEVYRDVGAELHHPADPAFIDVFRAPFEEDAALLLCSDGLTDLVGSATIAQIVEEFAGHAYEIVRSLIQAANDAGGKDNVTIVYVEGSRFAEGEDTRDIAGRRAREAAPVPQPATGDATISIPRDSSAPAGRRSAWRVPALIALLTLVIAVAVYAKFDFRSVTIVPAPVPSASTVIIVAPGTAIASAIERAGVGTEIRVEPGEYRERLVLKTGVRLRSRVPRGALIRLPAGASESDAAIVAIDVSDAEVAGFRIVGDAATPLGTGVSSANSALTLTDVEIQGAQTAAVVFDTGATGGLLGSDVHDNPGVGVIVRNGAAPRIAHNSFRGNATSGRAAGPILIEAGARPEIRTNTFIGLRPDAIISPAGEGASAIAADNWFVPPPRPSLTPPGAGRRGRGSR
jgi:serine/threonine protein phosphatase PrpC